MLRGLSYPLLRRSTIFVSSFLSGRIRLGPLWRIAATVLQLPVRRSCSAFVNRVGYRGKSFLSARMNHAFRLFVNRVGQRVSCGIAGNEDRRRFIASTKFFRNGTDCRVARFLRVYKFTAALSKPLPRALGAPKSAATLTIISRQTFASRRRS